MSYNIGLNVIEVDGAGAPAIAGAATSVAGFNVLTRRGLPNTPARITSFSEFVERFGGHFTGGYGAYLVKGFFDNDGAVAYVNRVVATGASASTAASLTLQDTAPANTLKLEAGWRGTADPGSWGRGLYARTTRSSVLTGLRLAETAAAVVTAATALGAETDMVTPNFPSLVVTIDGQSTPTTITFNSGNFQNAAKAKPEEFANAINNFTDDLDATVVGNKLRLTSAGNIALKAGGFTSVAVALNTTLGFTVAANSTATTTTLAAGGATLHSVDGLKPGDVITLNDGSPPAETVKLVSVNPLTRAVTWTPGLGDPTNYAPLLLRMATQEFNIEVFQGGTDVDQNRVEQWVGLSMENDVSNYVAAVLNDAATGSRFVRAVDMASASGIGTDRPANLTTPVAFTTGGVDGVPTSTDFIGDQATRKGFYAFDPFDVQLVTCERTDLAIARAGIDYCEARDDCMYVGAIPETRARGRLRRGLRPGAAGHQALRRPVRPLGAGVGPDRGRRRPDQADPAGRPRHGRLRPDRADARHLEGPGRRRGPPARRAGRASTACPTATTPTW